MVLPGSYANGFAPRDGHPLYPSLWRGCVGAWAPCLGPTGLTLRDWSGYANHGTLTNMTSGSDWITDQGRWSLDFDGANDVVTMTPGMITGTSPFTMSAWCRFNATPSFFQGVMMIGGGTTGTSAYIGWVSSASFGTNNSWGGGGFGRNYGSGITDVTGWHHVLMTSTGGGSQTFTIWVDGKLMISGTETITLVSTHLRIGANPSDAFVNGKIDDCRLYNRVLSDGEIKRLASRRGVAYDLAPRRRASVAVQFNRRRRLLIGAH